MIRKGFWEGFRVFLAAAAAAARRMQRRCMVELERERERGFRRKKWWGFRRRKRRWPRGSRRQRVGSGAVPRYICLQCLCISHLERSKTGVRMR